MANARAAARRDIESVLRVETMQHHRGAVGLSREAGGVAPKTQEPGAAVPPGDAYVLVATLIDSLYIPLPLVPDDARPTPPCIATLRDCRPVACSIRVKPVLFDAAAARARLTAPGVRRSWTSRD